MKAIVVIFIILLAMPLTTIFVVYGIVRFIPSLSKGWIIFLSSLIGPAILALLFYWIILDARYQSKHNPQKWMHDHSSEAMGFIFVIFWFCMIVGGVAGIIVASISAKRLKK